MITFLLVLMTLTIFSQNTESRRLTSAIYVGLVISSDLFFGDLPGEVYFVMMAFINLTILLCFRYLVQQSALGVRLSYVCLLSIITNAIGFLLWWHYYPPTLYVTMFVLIYSIAIISLLKQDDSDVSRVGNIGNAGAWFSFSSNHRSGIIHSDTDKG